MEQDKNNESIDKNESFDQKISDRRDMVKKLGRFAMYAAPFTALALTQKAEAATGKTPGRH